MRYKPNTSMRYKPNTLMCYKPNTSMRYKPNTSMHYKPPHPALKFITTFYTKISVLVQNKGHKLLQK
jgi:hypothetical protein